MRYDLYNHLASSALRLLQEVADDPNVHQAAAPQANVHPNLNGCVDSPEASTMILMLVGTIGIYCGSVFFSRMMRRRESRNLAAGI